MKANKSRLATPYSRLRAISFIGLFGLSACGGDVDLDAVTQPEEKWMIEAEERKQIHQVSISVTTPFTAGEAHIYRLLDGDLSKLEVMQFENGNPSLRVTYSAPISTDSSAVFLHFLNKSYSTDTSNEVVCFAPVSHTSTRHNADINCDLTSTVAYYLATQRIGQSSEHPFHDIQERYPIWKSILSSPENDVFGFYASIFGTLQTTLVGMGSELFKHGRYSVRPIMETVVVQFMDAFQRQGSITSKQLVKLASEVIDHSIPLARLPRYDDIFHEYKYIAEGSLEATGGSLIRRGDAVQLLTLDNEVTRFYTSSAPYEMSDYRTHVVQNISHTRATDDIEISWEPIPHMYGYNLYFNGQHIGFTRLPKMTLPDESHGTVTIKAVGYAGEFDGVHHELSGPTLVGAASQ